MNSTTTTTANTVSIPDAPTVNESLVRTATDKLTKSLGADSLDDLVAARTRRSLLLCDCSGSMSQGTKTHERRIDALRKVVTDLRETHPVPVAAFSGRGVRLVDDIPEPSGGTPMAEAIDYGREQGANHLLLIADGEVDRYSALVAAKAFGGPIDTFYIGDGDDRGFELMKEIAAVTGGVAQLTDLGAPKALASKMRLMIGDGSL